MTDISGRKEATKLTEEVIERRKLWLSWLELPWDVVREDLAGEMHRVGMSQADLAFELRTAGYRVSEKTVGRWLGAEEARGLRPPTMDALQALVGVFARVSVGDWAKGRLLSSDELTYSLRLMPEPLNSLVMHG